MMSGQEDGMKKIVNAKPMIVNQKSEVSVNIYSIASCAPIIRHLIQSAPDVFSPNGKKCCSIWKIQCQFRKITSHDLSKSA